MYTANEAKRLLIDAGASIVVDGGARYYVCEACKKPGDLRIANDAPYLHVTCGCARGKGSNFTSCPVGWKAVAFDLNELINKVGREAAFTFYGIPEPKVEPELKPQEVPPE